MTLDDLFAHCADLGLDVEWDDLGEYRRGEYHRHGNLILLNNRLTVAQATSTLAHEIGHHMFGDTCSTPAAERRAWEYAAALLIPPYKYAIAEGLVGSHLSALALELGVTPRVIESWRYWYQRRGHLLVIDGRH